jgi:serine/threonine protein kinase
MRVKLQLMHQMARSIVHLHAGGIMHLDIKPLNALLDNDGNAKWTDFGQRCEAERLYFLTRCREVLAQQLQYDALNQSVKTGGRPMEGQHPTAAAVRSAVAEAEAVLAAALRAALVADDLAHKAFMAFALEYESTASAAVERLPLLRLSNLCASYLLGKGTFSSVFAGRYEGEEVAIKIFKLPCRSALKPEQRMWKEAALLYGFAHDHIVPIKGVYVNDSDDGCEYGLVMARMAGSAHDAIYGAKAFGPQTVRQAITMSYQVARRRYRFECIIAS